MNHYTGVVRDDQHYKSYKWNTVGLIVGVLATQSGCDQVSHSQVMIQNGIYRPSSLNNVYNLHLRIPQNSWWQ